MIPVAAQAVVARGGCSVDWRDWVNRGLERLTEVVDPGTPVHDDHREHRRGAQLYRDRRSHASNVVRVHDAERSMLAWERDLLRNDPGDAPGVRLLGNGGLTQRQETEGIALVGAQGVGKTTMMRRVIRQAISRGDLVCVHDAKGEYTQWLKAAHPATTALLAPWDKRAARWLLGEDLRTRLDAQDGAATFVPDIPGDRQPFWRAASRGVLEGVLLDEIAEHHGRSALWSWGDLWCDWFARGRPATVARLSRSAEGRAAASVITGKAEKASSEDVWSTLVSIINPLKHLAAAWPDANPERAISVRAWLARATPYQVVILPTIAGYEELGKTVSRLWVQLMARQLLSMPDSRERRVWVVLDEVPRLGEVPALLELQTRSRAKGGRICVGTQDVGQLRAVWGRDRAMALLNVGTLVVFRTSDPELAEWAAKALGRRELTEWQQSRGEHHGHEDTRSHSWTAHTREEYLVLPSELAQLPPLVAYTRVAGWPFVMPWSWSTPASDDQQTAVVEEADWVSCPIDLDDKGDGAGGAPVPGGGRRQSGPPGRRRFDLSGGRG